MLPEITSLVRLVWRMSLKDNLHIFQRQSYLLHNFLESNVPYSNDLY